MNKPYYFSILGDVHGHYDLYVRLAQEAEYSLQLGDLGFSYDCLKHLDGTKHKVLAGNHDNYSKDKTGKFIHMQTEHWLGDYGVYEVPKIGQIFYIRGGYSIDWRYRVPNESWWDDEQLDYRKMEEALKLYSEIKPDFVVSHECPGSIIDLVFGAKKWDGEWLKPSLTAQLLDRMWEVHAPKRWIHGHHHTSRQTEIKGTHFQCLAELESLDFDEPHSN